MILCLQTWNLPKLQVLLSSIRCFSNISITNFSFAKAHFQSTSAATVTVDWFA